MKKLLSTKSYNVIYHNIRFSKYHLDKYHVYDIFKILYLHTFDENSQNVKSLILYKLIDEFSEFQEIFEAIFVYRNDISSLSYFHDKYGFDSLNTILNPTIQLDNLMKMDRARKYSFKYFITKYNYDELSEYFSKGFKRVHVSKTFNCDNISIKKILLLMENLIEDQKFHKGRVKCWISNRIDKACHDKDPDIILLLEFRTKNSNKLIMQFYPEFLLENENILIESVESFGDEFNFYTFLSDPSLCIKILIRYCILTRRDINVQILYHMRYNIGCLEWYKLIPYIDEYNTCLLNMCIYDRLYCWTEIILKSVPPDFQSCGLADEKILTMIENRS